MAKSATITERGAAAGVPGSRCAGSGPEGRKDHLKVWRQIYQEVRRQWAEAESGRESNR